MRVAFVVFRSLSWECQRNCLTDRRVTSHNVLLSKFHYSYEISMMFAQTGLNSTPPSTDLPESVSASSSLWWLIGLSFVFVALALYLRRQRNRREQSAAKAITKGKSLLKEEKKAPPIESSVASISPKSREITPSRKAGKKSKKNRSPGDREGKGIVAQQVVPKSNLTNSSDISPNLVSSNPPTTIPPSTIPPTIVAPVTTAAIF